MSRKMKLDFTGVESFQRAAEGEHLCKIAQVDEKTSQGGNEMIVVVFEVIKGESKSARVYENYPLMDTALWKLKGLLQAIGMKADGKVQLDLDKLVGKTCIVGVKHEEYEGKTRARVDYINRVSSVDTDDDDEDVDDTEDEDEQEEEKPAKTKATEKKAAKKPEPKADDDDDDDWDDEEEEEEKPKKKASKPEPKEEPKKAAKKDAKKSKSDDDDDDDWDDDDWDE